MAMSANPFMALDEDAPRAPAPSAKPASAPASKPATKGARAARDASVGGGETIARRRMGI